MPQDAHSCASAVLEGEQRRLGVGGIVEAIAGEHGRQQRLSEEADRDLRAAIEGHGERRLHVVERPPHARVLGALAREQEPD